jgi:hypothetical protein
MCLGARALEDDVAKETVDIQREIAEQKLRQIAAELEVEEFDEINDKHHEILTCQSYLAAERPVDDFDCESIISTYSTLDNHPSIIKVYLNFFLRSCNTFTYFLCMLLNIFCVRMLSPPSNISLLFSLSIPILINVIVSILGPFIIKIQTV